MDSVEYKGHELAPAPYQLRASEEWEVRVSITRHNDAQRESREKVVCARNRAASRDEAERQAIAFGNKVIDGLHKDVSLEDLSSPD